MGIKKKLTEILASTALALGIGFTGSALAQEIVKPEIIKPTPVEEKQEYGKKEYEKKQEKKEGQEKSEHAEFDNVESCEETGEFKTGQLRLNSFNSEDLNRLDASAKLVFADKNGSRFNLYSLVSGVESKGEEGSEGMETTFQRHGIGLGKYFDLNKVVLYPELQFFYERADHESPTRVNLTREDWLLGGKLGYSNKLTGTKVLGQALFGQGGAEGRVSPTKSYDDLVERLRLGLTFVQRLTPHIKESEGGLSLRLDTLFDKTNYKGLQKDELFSLRLGMPYVVCFKGKGLTVEPFLTWRKEQTDYNNKSVRENYFGGGLAFKYRVGNFEFYLIPGYDKEHGVNASIGLVFYIGKK